VLRLGETLLPVNVVSNLWRVFEQFRPAGDTAAKPVSYRLVGKLSMVGIQRRRRTNFRVHSICARCPNWRRIKPRPAGVPLRQMFRWTPGA